MLLQACLDWSKAGKLELWPFALEHAVCIWNNVPRQDSKKTPWELFTGNNRENYSYLNKLHVWGCPVYVLDPKLQDGKKLPKWKARTRRGQYLGYSPEHSSHIGRILNLRTGYVSEQFHVVYDDHFSSVPNLDSSGFGEEHRITEQEWEELLQNGFDHGSRLDGYGLFLTGKAMMGYCDFIATSLIFHKSAYRFHTVTLCGHF